MKRACVFAVGLIVGAACGLFSAYAATLAYAFWWLTRREP